MGAAHDLETETPINQPKRGFMTDLNTTEAYEAPTSDATMLNPADFTPKTEPTRKFSGDAHGIAEAASERGRALAVRK